MRRGDGVRRAERPEPLQGLIDRVCGILLSSSAPVMASYMAGQIYSRTARSGRQRLEGETASPPIDAWQRTLSKIKGSDGELAGLMTYLEQIGPHLSWYRSRVGPFASVNFEKSHAHSTILGPGGVEERSDVQLGVTLMAPYCRFPDHFEKQRRVFLFLSAAEACLRDREWMRAEPGTIVFSDAGDKFALRCTSEPVLAVWCQLDDRRR